MSKIEKNSTEKNSTETNSTENIVLSTVNSEPLYLHHNKDYEDAEIKLKLQEIRLKDAETKLKYQEVQIKKTEVQIKKQEIEYKKQEAELKKQEAELKKQEAEYKRLECMRYDQETKHQNKINKSIETAMNLKTLESRLRIIHDIGIKFSDKKDMETLLKMTHLLGDNIPKDLLDDIKPVSNKIDKTLESKRIYT